MKTQDYIKKFSYVGNSFQEWFYDMKVSKPQKVELFSQKLDKEMNDKEIKETYNPTEVSLGEMFTALETLKHNEWCIFYIKDKKGVLRAVGLRWSDDGWRVRARAVEDPDRWLDGGLVFSRKPFNSLTTETLSSFGTMSLDNAIKIVKDAGYKIIKEI